MKKYVMLILSTFILLILGATYTYSVFLSSFKESFSVSSTLASIPFSVFLFSYALGMGVAGRLYYSFSPKILAFLGGLSFSLGFILSSFVSNIFQLSLTYGFLGGFGLAFAYVTPITLVSEWFKEKKGFASGIVISAFGLGSFFLSPLSKKLISSLGWQNTLRYEGLVFLCVISFSSLLLQRPEFRTDSNKTTKTMDLSSLIKSSPFRYLWISYVLALTTGLMIMGHIVPLSEEMNFSQGALLLSIIAIFNALGRITFGALGDKYSGTNLLKKLHLLQCLVFILFLISYKAVFLLYIITPLFGFVFGGWLVLYPVVSSEHYGLESLSSVYGYLFSSYGIAGVIGPIAISYIHGYTGSYHFPLILSSLLCIMATLPIYLMQKKQKA